LNYGKLTEKRDFILQITNHFISSKHVPKLEISYRKNEIELKRKKHNISAIGPVHPNMCDRTKRIAGLPLATANKTWLWLEKGSCG
jgi:hypothetical protein